MSTKLDFLEKVQAQLAEWNAEIEKLQATAGKVKADAKHEYTALLEKLRARQTALRSQLQVLTRATDEGWEELKTGVENASTELQQALEQARHTARDAAGESLGWAEGMAESRQKDSEGWAEGVGHKAGDSQGWVEGMGKKEADSRGWAEGFEQ